MTDRIIEGSFRAIVKDAEPATSVMAPPKKPETETTPKQPPKNPLPAPPRPDTNLCANLRPYKVTPEQESVLDGLRQTVRPLADLAVNARSGRPEDTDEFLGNARDPLRQAIGVLRSARVPKEAVVWTIGDEYINQGKGQSSRVRSEAARLVITTFFEEAARIRPAPRRPVR